MFRIFAFSLILMTASISAHADNGTITRDMIDRKNAEMEQKLNNRSDIMDTIRFLHEHISENAAFKLTVTNPTQQGGKSPVMEMNKTDYINTYIQGTHYVADYSVDIETKRFEYNPQLAKAMTVDVMTERGRMMSDMNGGKPFVSRTTCKTQQEMRQGAIVATASECHTDISFEEEI